MKFRNWFLTLSIYIFLWMHYFNTPLKLEHRCTYFYESPRKTLFGLFDSPCAGIRPHVREGVKRHDIHNKPKSYKLELLGELVV